MFIASVIKKLFEYGAILVITYIFCYVLWVIYMETSESRNNTESLMLSNQIRIPNKDLETTKEYRLPNAIIIGISHCGTRALLNYFKIHPDTSHNLTKNTAEVNFFNDNYELGLEWYKQKMVPASKGQTVMEKSPSYFMDEGVAERVYQMNSSIKLVLIMCDPVRRAVSHYARYQSRSRLNGSYLEPFEEMVLDEDGNVSDSMQRGCYIRYLKRWLNIFPLHQIHIVDGDELRKDPFPEVKKVEKFLGLADFYKRSHLLYVDQKGFYCLNPPSLPKRVVCLGETKGRKHEQVDPVVRQKLETYYRNCNSPINRLINKNFQWSSSS